jgi:replicative DNA helicase
MADRRVDDRWRDLALEKDAIGLALIGQAADLRDEGLQESSFSYDAHQLAWRACVAVLEDGGDPNPITVGAWLRANDLIERVKASYLFELTEARPKQSAANIVYIVGRLQELEAGREVERAERSFKQQLQTNPDALSDGTVDDHIATLDKLRQRHAKVAPWLDVEGQWVALRQEAKRSAEGSVLLGIQELDAVIDGVRPGEVLGLMGRPGLGKTILLCHHARWMAHAQLPHVFFSLEMPAAQIVTRIVQAEYELKRFYALEAVRTGSLDPAPYHERFEAFRLVDRGGLSVTEMSQRLRRLQEGEFRNRPIRAITIDHLGLIGGDRKLATYDRVSLQVREIKELAKAHNLAVILAIQVNRDAGGDGSKELHLGSARDSGVVEEAMDYLIGMRRFDRSEALPQMERDRYKDILFLKVIKSRHGTPGEEVSVQFDHTLDVRPIAMAVPESAAKVAHFGGRR